MQELRLMQDVVRDLKQTLEAVEERLREISEVQSELRPAPGAWSAKEILGHLIDSAANNHRRFVEAQFRDDLAFPGYAQEAWVAAQRYQDAPWSELIALWKVYNLHLAHVVSCIPEEVLQRPRGQHTLDKIAWQTVSPQIPVTLEVLIRDYYGHLQMHLDQLFTTFR
jgi:hypothetical protein